MTRKRRRLYFLLGGVALLGVATALTLSALNDNLVFFYSPTELLAKGTPPGRMVRIGGLVDPGSLHREADGMTVDFRVTDTNRSVPVTYKGDLPDLFREGQGVVVEGKLQDRIFQASNVLAKHDERYMPPEVAAALKKEGRWREGEPGGPVPARSPGQ